MGTALEKEWKKILMIEEKMFSSAENKKETKLDGKIKEITGKIEGKIPEKLEATLDAAFYNALRQPSHGGEGSGQPRLHDTLSPGHRFFLRWKG